MPTDKGTRQPTRRTAAVALGLAAIVVLSVISMSGMAVAVTTAQDAESTADSADQYQVESADNVSAAGSAFGSADELYLNDDGSGVLVYTDDSDEVKEFQLGADVSEGLAHVLIADDIEDDGSENVEGELTAELRDDLFTADGSLTMEQPPEVEELDVEISGEQSAETNEFDADVYALIGGGSGSGDIQQLSTGTQSQQLFNSAETSGQVDVTADTFQTSGDVNVDMGTSAMAGAADTPQEELAFELTETDDGYVVDVTQYETVNAFFEDPTEKWETEEQAKATLEEQYTNITEEIGGSATVEIEHHKFEKQNNSASAEQDSEFSDSFGGQGTETYWKELEYTITYEGIDAGLETKLAEELANDSATDLSEDEAERIATQVTDVEIETVDFSLTSGNGTFDASWNVTINEYAAMTQAMMEMSEATLEENNETEDVFGEQFEEFDTRLEAQQAADLRTTVEWNASVETTADDRFEIEAQAQGDTENYDAYTDELADRGIDVSDEEVVFDFTATTEDGEINVDGEIEVGMEDLAEEMVLSASQALEEEGDEMGTFASTLEDSELEIAKMNANFQNETVEFEAGAKFNGTGSLVEDDLFGDNVVLTEIAGQQEDDGVATYVYVQDIESDDLSEDDLAESGLVDDETTVYEPGEGDRDFPEMDTERAANFLGVELEGSDDIPGFGPGVAIVGLGAVVAVLLARRQV